VGCTPAGIVNPPVDGDYDARQTLAISPAGDSVYAEGAGAVLHYRRAASGSLSYAGCIGSVAGCTGVSLAGAPADLYLKSIAISSAGDSIYTAGGAAGGHGALLIHFRRNSNGDLHYAGCIGHDTPGCTPTPVKLVSASDRWR
jgi:hypothetical protein